MNKTQCPHCFTVYQITEEQLLKSKGNVRCGSCHERFKATLITDAQIQKPAAKPQPKNDLFGQSKPTSSSDLSLEDRQGTSGKGKSGSGKSGSGKPSPSKSPLPRSEPKLDDRASDDEAPHFEFERNNDSLNEQSSENSEDSSSVDIDLPDRFTHFEEEPSLGELSEPNFDDDSFVQPPSEPSIDFTFGDEPEDDQRNSQLIDELDRIIDNNLVDHTPRQVRPIDWGNETQDDDIVPESEDLFVNLDGESDDDFDLESREFDQPSFGNKLLGFVKFVLLLSLLTLSILALAYQVWLMPSPSVRNNQVLQTTLNSVFNPLLDFAQSFGVKLDRPSELSGLTLVSAQSEPHPSRASTTLLRVSFLNKSSVTLPLPWIELSLTDENGAVIARRALDPTDYLFNNAALGEIGPHELKKITVELLAFPKKAIGFELRVLESAPE